MGQVPWTTVIGGLAFATVTTLIFVPVVFSIVHRKFGRGPQGLSPAGSPPAGSPQGQHAPGELPPRDYVPSLVGESHVI